MLSAKEAYSKAITELSEKTVEELAVCEKSINEAVKEGELSCWIYRGLGEQTVNNLRRLGYDVKNQTSSQEGDMFQISWNLKTRKDV